MVLNETLGKQLLKMKTDKGAVSFLLFINKTETEYDIDLTKYIVYMCIMHTYIIYIHDNTSIDRNINTFNLIEK